MSSQSDRDAIIGAIRKNLGARGDEPGRRGRVRTRIERSPNGIIPERAGYDLAERIDQFTASLKSQGVTVEEVENLKALPGAIATILAEFNLPAQLRHGDDPLLATLDWSDTLIETQTGAAHLDDATSLSRAVTATAETGTLVLTSGTNNPSTLNFLPETHLVVLMTRDLCGSYEEAWDRIRAIYGRGNLPSTVNYVSGPSASADIEQTLVRGAHGPKRLAVFLVAEK
ncbi:MAG: lactate utilization protein [Hyphomicrobiales bacterium]|nr:lactate utilization protein [Hyphomicrobiales bacterium]